MSVEGVTRRLTTILAADVVGFSRLMGEDEEETLATLRANRQIIDRSIAQYRGRVFSGAGDSVMAEFPSPVQAVRCAVRIQEDVGRRNADLPESRRMLFRIGINLGDVMVEEGNLFGNGVNIAARIESLAKPGGICLSEVVYQQIRNKLALGYERLGKHSVKNIADPVVVYRVVAEHEAGATALRRIGARLGVGSWTAAAGGVVLVIAAGGVAAWLWPRGLATDPEPDVSTAVLDVALPTRHFKVENPANLADADALTIYDRIVDDMVAEYRKSADPSAENYYRWRRYNTAPYRSTTHGNRYVNNYANETANAYGKFERAGTLPEGSILAKDSFEVTDRGDVLTGPLFLMEKMEPAFNPTGRDWRYTMIMPNGTLFGTTKGENAERVEFCRDCHADTGDAQDHLYFLPNAYRTRFLNLDEDTGD